MLAKFFWGAMFVGGSPLVEIYTCLPFSRRHTVKVEVGKPKKKGVSSDDPLEPPPFTNSSPVDATNSLFLLCS